MRRLSVKAAHLDTCVEKSVYAVPGGKPQMEHGELLLFHLKKTGATQQEIQSGRTNFALVLDRIEEDPDTIKQLWPDAPSSWRWLLYGFPTIPTIPFSLDDTGFDLSRSYGVRGMENPAVKIEKEDEEIIKRYILGALAEKPDLKHQWVDVSQIIQEFGKQHVLSALSNHDHIVSLRAAHKGVTNREKDEPNPYLAKTLASYYEHCCQICGKNPLSDYGVACSQGHYIQPLAQGGRDVSRNIVVLCPNHRCVIQATNAHFNLHSLAFEYPNGWCEPLQLRDHFEK